MVLEKFKLASLATVKNTTNIFTSKVYLEDMQDPVETLPKADVPNQCSGTLVLLQLLKVCRENSEAYHIILSHSY